MRTRDEIFAFRVNEGDKVFLRRIADNTGLTPSEAMRALLRWAVTEQIQLDITPRPMRRATEPTTNAK